MSDHLSPETVSELSEGLLAPAEAAAAERHLAGCADCTGIRDQLRSVSLLLGSLPQPGPMPPDVVARVEAALSEAQVSPTEPLPSPSPAGPEVVQLDAARERRKVPRSTRWLQAAAAVVLIAGAGAVIVPAVLNSTSQSDSQTSTAGGGAEMDSGGGSAGAARVSASGRDYTSATVGPAAAALAAGQGPVRAPATRNSAPPKNAPTAPQPAAGGGSAADASRLSDPVALQSCVETLAGPGVVPLAVDIARFDGQPAAVIVLPGPSPDRLSVYVVGPGCSQGDDQTKYFATVPR